MNELKTAQHTTYPFLEGGGEMGELTRLFDWSSTPVGPIYAWPSILRTTVSNLLHTRFPMFLWWGEDMIQFYNDGYRPSFGETGKHPTALGQRAEDCWPEIWDIIFPLIEKVKIKRESFFLEDQLVPIYRNGKLEDVYWTFSYSPVMNDEGFVEGVLVVCTETTKNVQAVKKVIETRAQIQQSEANLTNVFMHAPAAMAILEGPEHIFRLVNEKYQQLIGKERNVVGLGIKIALPEIANAGFYELLDEVYQTGKPFHGREVSVMLDKHGDGILKESFVDFVYQPRIKGDGEITGVLVHAVDITEQVLSRKKIEQSEQRLRNIISEAHVATAVYTGPEMKIEYANDAMISVWGKDQSVVGLTLKQALPELEGQPFHQLLENVYTTGEMYWGKEDKVDLVVNGNLGTHYFNFTYKPLRSLDGSIYGILNMAIEVTEQFLYRKQVEQSEKNLKNLILKAPVAMCLLLGPAHVVRTANDAMIALWGKKRAEVMDKPIFEALPDAGQQGLESLLDKVYHTGESFSANERPVVLMRNGKPDIVYQNFVYEPYRNADGVIIGVLAISNDVTAQVNTRHKIEQIVAERTEQLANANLELRRSNHELSQFAYIASHDLQGPARKITTFTDLLSRSLGDVDPKAKRYIEKIESSSLRMLTLIRDVLTFSEVSTAVKEVDKIDLNQVLNHVKMDFELVIEEKQAVIESNRLPVIDGINIQILQLFSNLISNSLKFALKDKKPVIKIESRLLTVDEVTSTTLDPLFTYYQIDFTDNGIGFNQQNAEQIFDIFKRLHGKSEFEGTGIGLAICKKIVQNHGGEIHAKSAIGHGATFQVILPAMK
jgi:PAS domain S-box-containing protein